MNYCMSLYLKGYKKYYKLKVRCLDVNLDFSTFNCCIFKCFWALESHSSIVFTCYPQSPGINQNSPCIFSFLIHWNHFFAWMLENPTVTKRRMCKRTIRFWNWKKCVLFLYSLDIKFSHNLCSSLWMWKSNLHW